MREDDFIESSVELAALVLAGADMWAVERTARYIAERDPTFVYFQWYAKRSGDVSVEDMGDFQKKQLRTADPALSDIHVRAVLETGMIVTYARPFSRGDHGFPLSKELQRRVVPKDQWGIHANLLQLRRQVAAHTDTTEKNPVRYDVVNTYDHGPGAWRTQYTIWGGRLNEAAFRAVADLAAAVAKNLREETDAVKAREYAQLPIPPEVDAQGD